ncbi:MAG: hypothetical protein CVV42_00110 [Candidatus Riflebacteria bacterium HGW-Riflebacteria-2]|nr:MAG: hypothetical protein CVV42_00110 [Candidatus Riflebacteria bacterium HGW-Riflebacteria-2]
MNENEDNSRRVKCPFCAELIMPEAVICRFCHSDLSNKKANTGKPPGMWQAAIWNLICPGLGAWRLGHRRRGVITMLVLVGALLIGSLQIAELVSKKVEKAMRTGNTQIIYSLTEETKDNFWMDVFFYGYIISFIDLWFLVTNKQKLTEQKNKNEPQHQ